MAASYTPGLIHSLEVYRLDEFQRRAGLGEWAMRQARRAGLKTLRIGARRYVRGADFQEFLDQQRQRESG